MELLSEAKTPPKSHLLRRLIASEERESERAECFHRLLHGQCWLPRGSKRQPRRHSQARKLMVRAMGKFAAARPRSSAAPREESHSRRGDDNEINSIKWARLAPLAPPEEASSPLATCWPLPAAREWRAALVCGQCGGAARTKAFKKHLSLPLEIGSSRVAARTTMRLCRRRSSLLCV